MKTVKTIFIAGPTASGKTSLGIFLAKSLGGEVVSADSMQIYKGIHIASAAPDEAEKDGVVHHLIEFVDPCEEYSVADYVEVARECISDIDKRGKVPIVVGGTGLYINSLADNTEYAKESKNLELRAKLEEEYERSGGAQMLMALAKVDPDAAAKLHENDRKRIIRAFEVLSLTGHTITEQNRLSHKNGGLIDPLLIGIGFTEREVLYDRINRRVDKMLENGLLEEAENAFERQSGGAYQAIGHKEFFDYFNKQSALEECAEKLKQSTRRYAKRQLTWFRKDNRINWLYADTNDDIFGKALNLCQDFLKEKKQ